MSRVREYVQGLPVEELHKIVESWEKWEEESMTAMDSPLRSHTLQALPEMDSSAYIVQRMRDLAFETFRRIAWFNLPARLLVSDLTGNTDKDKWHPGSQHGFSMPPGKYWIGDLCYVQTDPVRKKYFELSEHSGAPEEHEGKFTIAGVTFGVFSTMHGDGTYPYDRRNAKVVHHHRFPGISVDAGSIGIVPWEALPWGIDYSDGIVVEFDREFWCKADTRRNKKATGEITFGDIVVYTNPKVEDDEDDDNGC